MRLVFDLEIANCFFFFNLGFVVIVLDGATQEYRKQKSEKLDDNNANDDGHNNGYVILEGSNQLVRAALSKKILKFTDSLSTKSSPYGI